MKIVSFHQVPQGLRLKGSQTRITDLPVGSKINFLSETQGGSNILVNIPTYSQIGTYA